MVRSASASDSRSGSSGHDELSAEATVVEAPPADGGAPASLGLGSTVGRYVILDELGAGGMGVVYAAYDPRLDRRIALKLLHRRRALGGAIDELLAEARALAKLNDANVVSVYDAEKLDGSLVLAMELVEGRTLHDWMNEAHEIRETLAVLLGAGRGLAAAHRAGIVHRDFKPGNVMIDLRGRARVMDFGLAVEDPAKTGGSSSTTGGGHSSDDEPVRPRHRSGRQPGALLGTPRYMAPEQLDGDPPTAASDQYTFCVVAYLALAGRHPHGQFESVGGLIAAMAKPPEPLSQRAIPRRVRAAIMRGLSRDPADRHPSMEALLGAFESEFGPRRVTWGASAVAVLAVAVGVYALRPAPDPCPSIRDKTLELYDDRAQAAVREAFTHYDRIYGAKLTDEVGQRVQRHAERWAEGYVDACEDTRVRREQAGRLMDARLACLEARRRDFDAAVTLLSDSVGNQLPRALDLIDELRPIEACADPRIVLSDIEPPPVELEADVAEVRDHLARVRSELSVGRWPEAERLAKAAADRATELGYAPLRAEALAMLGAAQSELHHITEAERTLQDAAFLSLSVGDRTVAIEATLELLELRRNIGELDETMAWRDRLADLRREIDGPEIDERIEMATAVALREVGKYEEARPHAERALALAEQIHGPGHPRTAGAVHGVAVIEYRRGDLEQALMTAQRALELRRRGLGEQHPEVASSYLLIAAIHSATDRYADAERVLLESLRIEREVVGPRGRMLAGGLNNLGSLYIKMGRAQEAEQALREAISIWDEMGIEDSQVYAYSNLYDLAMQRGDRTVALDAVERAWKFIEGPQSGLHALRFAIAAKRGRLEFERQAWSDVVTWYQAALAADGGTPEDRARLQAFLAYAQVRLGEPAPARRLAAEAVRTFGEGSFGVSAQVEAEVRRLAGASASSRSR